MSWKALLQEIACAWMAFRDLDLMLDQDGAFVTVPVWDKWVWCEWDLTTSHTNSMALQ
jgi:hypothetical protein